MGMHILPFLLITNKNVSRLCSDYGRGRGGKGQGGYPLQAIVL